MKKMFLIISFILLILAIPIAVFFVGQGQEIRSKAAPATTLSLTPALSTGKPGDTIVVNVEINTGGNQAATAKLSLLFDQTKAEALSITSGPFAPRILTQGITGPGTATITVAAESTAKPISGQGIIATVRLKLADTASGTLTVQFADDTFVGGLGEKNTNVLTTKTGATITLPNSAPLTSNGTSQSSFGQSATNISPPSTQLSITPTGLAPSATPSGTQPENLLAEPATGNTLTLTITPESTKSGKPLFKGKAIPESTITIIIYSTPTTTVVTADKNGNWQYTPTTPLADGAHSVVITAVSPGGITQTTSQSFSVGAKNIGGITVANDATLSAMPESGSYIPTILLLIGGFIILTTGIAIPYIIK